VETTSFFKPKLMSCNEGRGRRSGLRLGVPRRQWFYSVFRVWENLCKGMRLFLVGNPNLDIFHGIMLLVEGNQDRSGSLGRSGYESLPPLA